jgi:F-type H+-transporting ATPase subunit a
MALVPGLPLQFPFYFLGLLSSTIQALVFTLLATVYIALWLPHGHHAEEHGHH